MATLPSTAKAIVHLGRRIDRCCSARIVYFGREPRMPQAVGAEHAATCATLLDGGKGA
jgi:hypothetical protein